MNNYDVFAKLVVETRKKRGLTQKQLAENLGMSHRTILQIEGCRSNPKLETAILIAKCLDISMDAIVFTDKKAPTDLPKCVRDYFHSKSEAKAQKLIELCKTAESLNDIP